MSSAGDVPSRRHGKISIIRSKNKQSYTLSEQEDKTPQNGLSQRSVSLNTLRPQSSAVVEPRMAQLETLEAKMASIEVSLSTTPRRRKSTARLTALRNGAASPRDSDIIRQVLKDKENVLQTTLKSHIDTTERQKIEERLTRVRQDIDNKRLAIKNLKMALERLDVSADDIDARIQQAELEYKLGREELNALSLVEEARALTIRLEDTSPNHRRPTTLYSCCTSLGRTTLHGVAVTCDPKSPRFGVNIPTPNGNSNCSALYIDWALEETGLCKGDRLIEVNGKLVINRTKEDVARLISAAHDPALLVVLRIKVEDLPSRAHATQGEVAHLRSELGVVRDRAEEAQRVKDSLKGDNLRLTHRISYLEEQVAELLEIRKQQSQPQKPQPQQQKHSSQRTPVTAIVNTDQTNVTSINITSPPSSPSPAISNGQADLQVFQKGPQVTALVANLPGMEVDDRDRLRTLRPHSAHSNVSSTHIVTASPEHHRKHNGDSYSSANEQSTRSRRSHSNCNHNEHRSSSNHSEQRSNNSYNEQRSSSNHNEQRSSSNHNLNNHNHNGYNHSQSNGYINGQNGYNGYQHTHNHNHHHLLRKMEKPSRKSLSAIEILQARRHSKLHDSRSVEELDRDETSSSRRRGDARSVKSLEFDSEPCRHSSKIIDYGSEPAASDKRITVNYESDDLGKAKPKPPKKPIRLSLHRAQSVETVPADDFKKPKKRNHKGEPPIFTLKAESKYQSALRWPNYLKPNSRSLTGHLSDGGKWC